MIVPEHNNSVTLDRSSGNHILTSSNPSQLSLAMIRLYLVSLAVMVLLVGQNSFALVLPSFNAIISQNSEPNADADCLNQTKIVVPSINTSRTEKAKFETIAAKASCQKDYTWDGSACVKSTIGESFCIENYELVDGSCQIVEDAGCPAGFNRSENGDCEIRVEFNVKCPPEHEWNGQSCIKTVQGVCPVGTVLENRICVHRQTAKPECSPDFELIGTQCRQRVDKVCSWGYQKINGECVLEERQSGVLQCPDDMRLEGNQCVSKEHQCPDGFVRNGTICLQITIECPPNSKLVANNTCVQVICNPVTPICRDGYVFKDGKCYPVVICEPGYVLTNNTCTKIVNVTCPDGFRLINNVCERYILCPPETVWNGKICESVVIVCPTGSVLVNGTCYRVGDPPFCPPNYELINNKCVCQTVLDDCPPELPVRLPNGTCVPLTCSPGFVLVLGKCVKIISCPIGFEKRPDGHCYPIRPICDKGYHYSGGACYPNKLNITEVLTTPPPTNSCHTDTCTHQITNHVVVDKPVNVVNTNENNIIVHLYEDGHLVKITRNNETEFISNNRSAEDEQEVVAINPEITHNRTETPNCCKVVSPRKCTNSGDRWVCNQRETERCGWFCTSSTIYLKPRRTVYRRPVLVMQPPPSWHRYATWGQYNGGGRIGNISKIFADYNVYLIVLYDNLYTLDCSGCISGGYSCSGECYQYDHCSSHDDCEYVDQQQFCQANAGDGCAEEDGCLE